MIKDNAKRPILVAITGASGLLYAQTFLEQLDKLNQKIHLIVSENAKKVIEIEGFDISNLNIDYLFDAKDICAPPASGSTDYSSMVILPCSMNTVAAISCGITLNLIHRAADCFLKQKRTLIICPRETPLSGIHLKNMLKLSNEGAIIFPLMPAFYQGPKTIKELVYNLTARIIDCLGLKVKDVKDWQEIYKNKKIQRGYEGDKKD